MAGLGAAVRIETLLLANHVEAVNGLLYISGGGWTDLQRRVRPGEPPPVTHFGLGVSVLVPWTETNRPNRLEVQIEDQDATAVVARLTAQFTVGRPPTLPPGEDQHQALALGLDMVFPRPGGYRVVARLDGEADRRTWPFRIHDLPAGG